MRKEDVKIGMLVKANSKLKSGVDGYVRPNDIGEVVGISDVDADVKWNNPVKKCSDSCWWINCSDFEPYEEIKKDNKMEEKLLTKADLEGMELRCITTEDINDFRTGCTYVIEDGGILDISDYKWTYFFSNLPESFTESELLKIIERDTTGNFEIVKQQPKTSKLSLPVTIKIDTLFDSPIEEIHKDGKFIFYGRMIMFISNNGEHGYSMCHPDDLKLYNREFGKALAYWRVMNK